MSASHLEFLVEEPSMEAFLRALLPRLLPQDRTFDVHPFQGKADLLGKLEARLRGYASWLPSDWRIFVVVDRDQEDCKVLKQKMESNAHAAGLKTRSDGMLGEMTWQLVNRIAIEELEAWYFGDWDSVRQVYPRVPAGIPQRHGFRDPDAIAGGTWESFERVLQKHGYFKTGLLKMELARRIAAEMICDRNRSTSFKSFHRALLEALA